ncbi:hypothetical protein PR048_018290 [Dryococelus australis]|uniref:ATP-dependent DNA helicase n=1 Tax=Dryococelus australis TaxID=614101 RepID=A0ABQ9HC12_9NEOP|nr:hypothetical protein PR048_018290 [Dryococelus australis]
MVINNEQIINLGMLSPNRPAIDLFNTDLQCELMFNVNDLNVFVQTDEPKLLPEQKIIYEIILHSIAAQQGGFFFLDAPGGTGKTLLIAIILAKIHSHVVLPWHLLRPELQQLYWTQCKIIVWDDCTMAHKYLLEALNRTLKNLRGNNRFFSGALLLSPGDFRQTLPVIPCSTYADEINACLKSSPL